jgi:3-oxoacyl-[acyl-carrier-protein] synthase-1
MRAGVSKFEELPYWDRKRWPVIGAVVPELSLDVQFAPRLVEMLSMAVQDCLSQAPELPWDQVPLLVGLAEPERPGSVGASASEIIPHVEAKLGQRFHASLSRVIPKGHTAGIEALRIARDLIQGSERAYCLVCGVDSYINASSLFWLDQNWRLKRERHTDGVIPGEAAAAVLVQRDAPMQAQVKVEVAGLGFGHEEAGLLSERPLMAIGMSTAVRQALAEASCGLHEISFRISDVTGEEYGFREMALMEGRVSRVVRKKCQPLWHAADSIGDTGAAAGVVGLVTAAAAWSKGYAPGSRAGCFTAAFRGDRAVALLRRPKE